MRGYVSVRRTCLSCDGNRDHLFLLVMCSFLWVSLSMLHGSITYKGVRMYCMHDTYSVRWIWLLLTLLSFLIEKRQRRSSRHHACDPSSIISQTQISKWHHHILLWWCSLMANLLQNEAVGVAWIGPFSSLHWFAGWSLSLCLWLWSQCLDITVSRQNIHRNLQMQICLR